MSILMEYDYTSAVADESPPPLAICPRCGRQIRIDGHCECEMIFFNKVSQ